MPSRFSATLRVLAAWGMIGLASSAGLVQAAAPEDPLADVADVPAQDLRAGGDANQRYFLVGAVEGAAAPAQGYALLVVLPGGDGSAEFHPFVRRIHKNVLDRSWLIAQAVAPEWEKSPNRVTWPTARLRTAAAKFTTEQFVEAILADVRAKTMIDRKRIFLLGWSSGGPPCYAIALGEQSSVTGAFVAMSIFKPEQMPAPGNAKGKVFYLLQSPDDQVTPIRFAETAQKTLGRAGAKVHLERYSGGHGWHGDVWQMVRDGIQWLERQTETRP